MSKKPKSDITLKAQRSAIVCKIASVLCTCLPIIMYAIKGFIDGTPAEKVGMGMCLIVALILAAVNIIFKYHIRSVIWIAVIGIYAAVQEVMDMLITVAVLTIFDEFVLQPLYKHYKDKAKINKEIDSRIMPSAANGYTGAQNG